jgi:hypothetical protein
MIRLFNWFRRGSLERGVAQAREEVRDVWLTR